MQCLLHPGSDEPGTCLLGGRYTACKTYRCYLTIGMSCMTGSEAKLIGKECGKSLVCGKFVLLKVVPELIRVSTGCDKKCNGCMEVNGESKCHYSGPCSMPRISYRKRSQLTALPFDAQESNLAYPFEDSQAV